MNGFGCLQYVGNEASCGDHDDGGGLFVSNTMCCACGGGLRPPSAPPMAGQPPLGPQMAGQCTDQDDGATGMNGFGCLQYVGNEASCGDHDDGGGLFVSNTMCCACGGA